MKYLKQSAIILFFSLLGELAHYFIPLPVPSAVYGLILLFAALCIGIVKTEQIRETASFLLAVIQLFFVGAAVNLIDYFDVIKDAWLPLVLAIFAVTIGVFLLAGKITQLIVRRKQKRE